MSTQADAERMLDKTLADTFPASDALSTLPNPSFDSFDLSAFMTGHQDIHPPAPKVMPAERKNV